MLISVEQAAKRLRKTERTIRRWLSEGTLTPYHPSHGRKEKYLVDDNEVERLATELELEQPEQAASDQDTSSLELEQRIMTHLENKLAALESRIAALERLLSVTTAVAERPATRTYQRRAIEPTGLPERLPPGSMQHFIFAKRHGVQPRTFLDHIVKNKVTVITHEKPNRPGEKSHWLSPEQQRAALVFWQANGTAYHECIVPGCPCHTAIMSGHVQQEQEQQLEQE